LIAACREPVGGARPRRELQLHNERHATLLETLLDINPKSC
jgi:hypothetical protein